MSPRPDQATSLSSLEQRHRARGVRHLAGVDEVGRGALAGPVVAAAVVLPPGHTVDGADDSKKLPADARECLAEAIAAEALCVAVGAANARDVERLNIRVATHLAMCRAVERLSLTPGHVLVDGRPVPDLGAEHTAVKGGDGCVHSIACASIVAKVTRDRLMCRLASRHSGYGWTTNVGYPTGEHRRALARLGATPHHRRSFAPVRLVLDPEPDG